MLQSLSLPVHVHEPVRAASSWQFDCLRLAAAVNLVDTGQQAGTTIALLLRLLKPALPLPLCCLQGIKITNNDTKSQVLDILKAEQAAKMMDIEQPDTAAMAAAAADKKLKKKKKKLRLAKDAKSSKSSKKAATAAAAGGAAAPMEG